MSPEAPHESHGLARRSTHWPVVYMAPARSASLISWLLRAAGAVFAHHKSPLPKRLIDQLVAPRAGGLIPLSPALYPAFRERFGRQAYRALIALGLSVANKLISFHFSHRGRLRGFRFHCTARILEHNTSLVAQQSDPLPQREPLEFRHV